VIWKLVGSDRSEIYCYLQKFKTDVYATTACIILIDLSQCVIINLYDTRTLYCDGGNGGEEEKLYAIGELLKIKARSLVYRSGGD
jgi:hypothetical protein